MSRLLAPGEAADVTDFTVVNDRSVGEVAREVVALWGSRTSGSVLVLVDETADDSLSLDQVE